MVRSAERSALSQVDIEITHVTTWNKPSAGAYAEEPELAPKNGDYSLKDMPVRETSAQLLHLVYDSCTLLASVY